MTYKPKNSSKRKTTTPSSKKSGVVLVRPQLDFTKPPEEQREAIREFARGLVQGLS